MNRQQKISESATTITVLAYELNTVALTIASEAEQLINCDQSTLVATPKGSIEMAARIHGLINQLHDAALALRYVRHNGQIPPRWSCFN
jgi:hypothetical protein